MRALLALLALAFAASTALADGTSVSLSSRDVQDRLRPYAETIEHCYTDHTTAVSSAGTLSVELTITRKGEVETVAIKTPGLDTKVGVKVAGCVVDTLDGVTFPSRRAKTTATVPYYFQRTFAADAGPFESCWKAEGCREQGAKTANTASHADTRYARSGWRLARHGSSSRSRVSRHADVSGSDRH
ncbi:MAG: AgmX/PglI C-terminal domain-containing protein [Kofleriaceae bacterium]